MRIVVTTKTTTEHDPETDELTVEKIIESVNVEQDNDADLIVRRVKAADQRVAGVRVFDLDVTEDGVPTVGAELT